MKTLFLTMLLAATAFIARLRDLTVPLTKTWLRDRPKCRGGTRNGEVCFDGRQVQLNPSDGRVRLYGSL